MTVSVLNRTLLIALLPVIALFLYLEGQKYDPALIRFTSSDIGAGTDAEFFPREIGQFSRSGQVRIYSKDNLYEYVDGHAEYFLSAGFERLTVAEYIRTGTEPVSPDIVVDIYDMGKALQAYGIFSGEVGDRGTAVQIGNRGAKTGQGISFISGKYYVKITSFQGTIPLEPIALEIEKAIGASPEEISTFSQLPDLGDVITTRYIKEAYRGIDFANNVMEREYRIEGNTVQVSLITGTEAEISGLIESYLTFFSESDTPFEKVSRNGLQFYKVMDPYEGDWYLVPVPGSLFGIYDVRDQRILNRVLASITASVKKK